MTTQNKGQCFTADSKQGKILPVLTEEEWNRREQELIDRMLKAIANEPEETLPFMKRAASFDEAFIPSLSRDAPSEFASMSKLWSQGARAKVSEWLKSMAGNSDGTSGIGSMSISVSHWIKMINQHVKRTR